MNPIHILCVATLWMNCAAFAAPDPHNAARWYALAVDRYMTRAADIDSTTALRRLVDNPDLPVPPGVADEVAQLEGVFNLVERAVRSDTYIVALDLAQGPTLDLPHLAGFSRLAEAVAADALVRAKRGDAAGAARRVAAIFRMADHAAEDRLLVSTLTAFRLFRQGERLTTWGVDRALFDAGSAAVVLPALERLGDGEPFNYHDALAREATVNLGWYETQFGGEDGLATLHDTFAPRQADPVARLGFSMMDADDLDINLRASELIIERVLDAASIEDPLRATSELRRLDEAIGRGGHGLLARTIYPSFAPGYAEMILVADDITRLRHVLSALAEERVTPRDAANAAVWYRGAIDTMRAMPESMRLRLVTFADGGDVPRGSLTESLDAAAAVIEQVRDAATVPGCIFRPRPSGPGPHAFTADHAGMRDLARFLHADLVRSIERRDFERVVDRGTLALRLAAHLGQDRTLTGSLVAHDVFMTTAKLLEPGVTAGNFTLRQRMSLLRAARDAGYRDPFGYEASMAATRETLAAWIRDRLAVADVETHYAVEDALGRCDADQLHFILFAAGFLADAASEERPADPTPLRDVLALKHVAAAHHVAPRMDTIVRAHRFDRLVEPLVPRIARLEEKRERAREDVRIALVALRGGAEPPQ